jgi:hypothetical protein
MASKIKDRRIDWHRTSLDRGALQELNERRDLKGLAQTIGHLSSWARTMFACTRTEFRSAHIRE